ncbi:MAG: hypothetical protein ACRD03_16025 [Acidimicrobiales bacterium]
MVGGNTVVLQRAAERMASSWSGQPSNVVEEAVFLLRLAMVEVTEEFGSS